MKCSHCSAYIPHGLALKNCPQCGTVLIEPPETTGVPTDQPPQKSCVTPVISAKKSNSKSSFNKSKLIITIVLIFGAMIWWALSSGRGLSRQGLQGRSYYISSELVTDKSYPANRIYQKRGSFYMLTVHYPEDLFGRVGGVEMFLTNGDSTHQANVNVVENRDEHVRYKIDYCNLKLEDGRALDHVNYHGSMTPDILKSQGDNKDFRVASKKTAELIPKADFRSANSMEEVYYGYILKKPPAKLILDFKIEVYTLDGSRSDTVIDTVQLSRVDGDSMDWIRARAR